MKYREAKTGELGGDGKKIICGLGIPATIWIADAHRGDGRRFVVRANEKLTAFAKTRIDDLRLRRF